MRRQRCTKIVATLGPSSSDLGIIEQLFLAGVDVFRLNFSHGTLDDHRLRFQNIRTVEKKYDRPIGILLDLQGPKLRIGAFTQGSIELQSGQKFVLDLDTSLGTQNRVCFPYPGLYSSFKKGEELLLDDGRLRLTITKAASDRLTTEVIYGGHLSDRKGVNIPNTLLPLSPLTPKDQRDLHFGLELGVDWIAMSFVQRPDDIALGRKFIAGRSGLLAKLEKPMAIDHLSDIVSLSDAVMVARGDLGVELPLERVPALQKRIIRTCRWAGKPVIVATQMLESMVHAPIPTRAEASDVATAVYDGADAVMLSAETASGDYPMEAVAMMDSIVDQVERDPFYQNIMKADHTAPEPTSSDAITAAAAQVAATISASAIVTFSTSGATTLRASRERPKVPILGLTEKKEIARRLVLAWGVHSVHTADIRSFDAMVHKACKIAKKEEFAKSGDSIAITAGIPFGTPGSTNMLKIEWVTDGK